MFNDDFKHVGFIYIVLICYRFKVPTKITILILPVKKVIADLLNVVYSALKGVLWVCDTIMHQLDFTTTQNPVFEKIRRLFP